MSVAIPIPFTLDHRLVGAEVPDIPASDRRQVKAEVRPAELPRLLPVNHSSDQTIREQVVGILSGPRRQLARIEAQVARYIDTLLSLNSTRILNDFDEIIRESGRRLEAEIRQILKDLRAAAETMLARAEATHAAGGAAIEARLRVLEGLRCRLGSRS